jgi:hypothetical protein
MCAADRAANRTEDLAKADARARPGTGKRNID